MKLSMEIYAVAERVGDARAVEWIDLYPNEMLPDALKFANAVGRHLISLCESA